ncbi:MAG: DNRLRE domain-containing protein [Patescibacteria group bacterium]
MLTNLSRSTRRTFFTLVVSITLITFLFAFAPTSNLAMQVKRYVIQPDSIAGKDTFYGTSYYQNGKPDYEELWFGGWGDTYYSFIDFDLSGSPDQYKAIEVRLECYSPYIGPNDPDLQLWRITGSWSENAVTIYNQPPAKFFSNLPPVNLGWNSYDVTRLYLLWKKDPSKHFGFKFVAQNNNNTRGSFQSSDNMINPDRRPRLVITYWE